MAKFFGYNAPFIGGNERILSRQVDDRLIRNDLLQLLLTAPGERVMRPDFGTKIRLFVFEQLDENGLDALRDNIKESVAKFEKRVTLTDIQFVTTENLLNIKLFGSFNFDRFFNVEGGRVQDAELLVELNIPTSKMASTLA